MEYRENPKFGRKIFFLNPPLSIENGVAEILKDNEFEVYIIRDYTSAKPVLRIFPNAICWIFIDDVLSYDAWYNFIKSFEYDDDLKSIFIGILTARAKPKEQENFLLNLKLPGGFVRLDQKVEEVTKQLEGILDLNGARGVRKYVRLDIDETLDVNAYFSNGNNLYSFKLKDISPAGFAAITPARLANLFQKGAFIRDVSITLGRYSFTCSIQIYSTTIIGNNCVVVAFFTDDTRKEILKKVHDFVYQTLTVRHKILVEKLQRDNTDYNIRPTVGGSMSEEEVEDAEEVTEEKPKADTDKKDSEDTKTEASEEAKSDAEQKSE